MPKSPMYYEHKLNSCQSCHWFEHMRSQQRFDGDNLKSEVHWGRCKRHAPTMTGYPVVFGNEWCGDHQMRIYNLEAD